MVATFENVVVHPTQALLRPPWTLFRGGPDWPRFWLRRDARHCRYRWRIPLDVRPRRAFREAMREEAKGTWCGPVSQHFGHAVANFGSRIAEASVLPRDRPLVFSARPGEAPPEFLWQILKHFGVDRGRVRIVSEPTRFASLLVAPQAEPLHGSPPTARHLALLDRLAGPAPSPDGSCLYVSRVMLWKGKIAGDAHIERALLDSDWTPFHRTFAAPGAARGVQAVNRCLVPWFNGAILSLEWKEAAWDRFVTGAPRPRTPSEQRCSDRKLRSRR